MAEVILTCKIPSDAAATTTDSNVENSIVAIEDAGGDVANSENRPIVCEIKEDDEWSQGDIQDLQDENEVRSSVILNL